jgi:hypothetical protein
MENMFRERPPFASPTVCPFPNVHTAEKRDGHWKSCWAQVGDGQFSLANLTKLSSRFSNEPSLASLNYWFVTGDFQSWRAKWQTRPKDFEPVYIFNKGQHPEIEIDMYTYGCLYISEEGRVIGFSNEEGRRRKE